MLENRYFLRTDEMGFITANNKPYDHHSCGYLNTFVCVGEKDGSSVTWQYMAVTEHVQETMAVA
jgi:hypothetical protein